MAKNTTMQRWDVSYVSGKTKYWLCSHFLFYLIPVLGHLSPTCTLLSSKLHIKVTAESLSALPAKTNNGLGTRSSAWVGHVRCQQCFFFTSARQIKKIKNKTHKGVTSWRYLHPLTSRGLTRCTRRQNPIVAADATTSVLTEASPSGLMLS